MAAHHQVSAPGRELAFNILRAATRNEKTEIERSDFRRAASAHIAAAGGWEPQLPLQWREYQVPREVAVNVSCDDLSETQTRFCVAFAGRVPFGDVDPD